MLKAALPRPRVSISSWFFEHSLSLALFGLFLVSWIGHSAAGWKHYNALVAHGERTLAFGECLKASHFWFESFQNFQSEFFAVATIVLLSIWLRHEGSSESKEVDAPHSKTGK